MFRAGREVHLRRLKLSAFLVIQRSTWLCDMSVYGHHIPTLTNFDLFLGRWLWQHTSFFTSMFLFFMCKIDKKKVVIQSSEFKTRQSHEIQQDRKSFQSESEDLGDRKIFYQVHLLP